jgi:hypothetical protein
MPIPVGVVLRKRGLRQSGGVMIETDHFDIENSHAGVEHL